MRDVAKPIGIGSFCVHVGEEAIMADACHEIMSEKHEFISYILPFSILFSNVGLYVGAQLRECQREANKATMFPIYLSKEKRKNARKKKTIKKRILKGYKRINT